MSRTMQVAHGREDFLGLLSHLDLVRDRFHGDIIREAGRRSRLENRRPERCVQRNQSLGQGELSGQIESGPQRRRDPQSVDLDDVVIGDAAFVDEKVARPVGVRVVRVNQLILRAKQRLSEEFIGRVKAEDERRAKRSVILAALEEGAGAVVGIGQGNDSVRDAYDVARRDGRAQLTACDACLECCTHADWVA